jgi:hypothetical protein
VGYDRPRDSEVGSAQKRDDGRQTAAQKAILGGGGEEGGKPEPKTGSDWAERGGGGGEPGRAPVALGGSSAGQGDRMPAGNAAGPNAPASNPKTKPGHQHES